MRTIPRCLGLALALLALGCQTGPRRGVADVVRTPGYQPDSLETVAFLGFARGSAAAEEAPAALEGVLESYLLRAQLPFTIVAREAATRRVVSSEGRSALQTVLDYWRDDKKVDKFELITLAREMAVGGFLLGLVDEWSQAAASGGAGESSTTRISATLTLYDGQSGRSVWRASSAESMESVGMLGGVSIGSEQETARTRELKKRSSGSAGDEQDSGAPGYDAVARVVARALVQALSAPE